MADRQAFWGPVFQDKPRFIEVSLDYLFANTVAREDSLKRNTWAFPFADQIMETMDF